MRTRILLVLLGGLVLAAPAAAQKTEDEARLVFTMGIAYTGSTDLWTVENQPVLVVPGPGFETLDLSRSLSGAVGVLFSGSYFPKPSLGLAGEIFFMGNGVHDQCVVNSASPSPRTEELCTSIDGSSKSTSAVLMTLGPVLRAGANQPISPYVRAQVGLLFSNLSPVSMAGTVTYTDPDTDLSERLQVVVYDDPKTTRVTAGFVFGAGVTAVLGKGWQLRTEVRDNLVQIATVGGPTTPGNYSPVIVNEWKNLYSIVIGADVVLEKKRGHRY